MRRFAAYDPPEYVEWRRDDSEVERFRKTIERDPERRAVVASLSREALLDLYRGLLRNRLSDIALKRMVRQGVISKAWLGTGEEASTVGPVHALRRPTAEERAAAAARWTALPHEITDAAAAGSFDVVAPMIRNSGACHEMGMPIADIFRAYIATPDSPSHGRDGHYGSLALGVLQPISHVGDVAAVVTGIALSFKMRGTTRVGLTWVGDGSTKTGIAHEAFNLAAVQRAPVIFIIQNNQIALGTRVEQHHRPAPAAGFANLPEAYGVPGGLFDGNNVLDAFAATKLAADICRRGDGPAMLVAETFRMGGHATHDEAEARRVLPQEAFERWGKRDPIGLYEEYLVDSGVQRRELESIEEEVVAEVDQAERDALASRSGG